ncbi:vitamin K epoxide reductase family protein [Prochlorothrix hollandica]|uniref:vitamin K epoxide reductase family protein n=1 Tax=Prochlorothrix hollandica TaxID=1223 RepID=UPI00333F01C0
MIRKRQIPWIHRWSRLIFIILGTIGAIGTAYLTYEKLVQGEVACPTSGCQEVLASPYATVFGLPLTVFGFAAYVAMVVFAAAPLLVNGETQKDLRLRLEQWTGLFLFLGGTAMVVFSTYLMFVLFTVIKAACIYCLVSAVFSLIFFIVGIIGREWEDVGQLFFTGTLVAIAMGVGALGLYAQVNAPVTEDPGAGPPITTASTSGSIELANHLKQVDAKMYGAYWCPHCHEQKELFGKEAVKLVPYVECDPQGVDPQPEQCREAGITGYPTWDIGGELYSGRQTLDQLADASGYQGVRDFDRSPLPVAPPLGQP